MTDQNKLRDRIAEVVHDENERLRSDNGLRYDPLKYDELPDKHRENRESIAQAIIDDLGLTLETAIDHSNRTKTASGNVRYGDKARVIGKWESS